MVPARLRAMFVRRRLLATAVLAASAAAMAACPGAREPGVGAPEPRAAQKPHAVESPHGARNDEYYWLRDDTRKNPEVLAYLDAENRYARAAMESVKSLERTLFAEMTGRIAQKDETAPVLENGWWYVAKWEPKQQFQIHVRKK